MEHTDIILRLAHTDQFTQSIQGAQIHSQQEQVVFPTVDPVQKDPVQLSLFYKPPVQAPQAPDYIYTVQADTLFNVLSEAPNKISESGGHPNLSFYADPSLNKDQMNTCCCQGCYRPLVPGSLYCARHGAIMHTQPTFPTIQESHGTAFEPYYARFHLLDANPTGLHPTATETLTLATNPVLHNKVENDTIAQTAITLVRISDPVLPPPENLNLNFKRARSGGKQCLVDSCSKLAVRSTKFCIGHGGGSRCQVEGCPKSAQGSTLFCIAHGGGKRCAHANCEKSALGSTNYCIAHGGGNRCSFVGCSKSAPGNTKHCIAHGGGKRCQVPGCNKSSQRSSYFCRAHGGGKSCLIDGCNKSAFGATVFCKNHGNNARPNIPNGCLPHGFSC